MEVGKCIVCGKPVTTEEGYIGDEKGNYYHEKCYKP